MDRGEYIEDSLQALRLGISNGDCCLMSSSVVADIYYIARKRFGDKEKALKCVIASVELFELAPVDEKCILSSITKGFSDFEDAIVDAVATNCHADCIVTRNKADFKNSENVIFNPKEFIQFRQ